MCTHYSEISDDKPFTLTSLVNILDATAKGAVYTLVNEFKSGTIVQRSVRTEGMSILRGRRRWSSALALAFSEIHC
ncbi:hypothetical protein TNCV_2100331 [Trichonephila clavipes]|nr:hypothetical protein TNCV_2100331 [Trichonephila clavipes]